MRRFALLCLLGFGLACQSEPVDDGDAAAMEVAKMALDSGQGLPPSAAASDSASFSHTETLDCLGGGTVTLSLNWSRRDEPYRNTYQVSWTYVACRTLMHGIIDGVARYSTNDYLVCMDTPNYVDAMGLTCDEWVGRDCTQADESGDYTEDEEKELLENCPKSCDACVTYFHGVHYYAELAYQYASQMDCNAYMTMSTKTADKDRPLHLDDHCKHPVRRWWGMSTSDRW